MISSVMWSIVYKRIVICIKLKLQLGTFNSGHTANIPTYTVHVQILNL